MLADSKCPKCRAGIEKFVGMQTPIPVISQNTGNTDQGEWSVKETERLAATAAGSGKVIVIHPLEDRSSPLYSSGHWAILADGWSLKMMPCSEDRLLQEPLWQESEKGYVVTEPKLIDWFGFKGLDTDAKYSFCMVHWPLLCLGVDGRRMRISWMNDQA